MERLKLIRSLCLLSALVIGVLPSIVNAQAMREDLRSVMPTQDPYCGGNYSPLSTVSSLPDADKAILCPTIPASPLSQIPANVVDWVLVELRAVDGSDTDVRNANVATVIARKPAFLLKNGRIVDAERYTGADPASCTGVAEHSNCPDVLFDQGGLASMIDNKELYLVVRHRNHLGVISNNNLTSSDGSAYTYNFTTGSSTSRGGTLGLKEVTARLGGVPVPAMYAGDADMNGNINFDDYDGAVGIIRNIGTGYITSDADMNANTNFTDYENTVSVNRGAGSQIP